MHLRRGKTTSQVPLSKDEKTQAKPLLPRTQHVGLTVSQSTEAALGCFCTEVAPTEITAACDPRPSSYPKSECHPPPEGCAACWIVGSQPGTQPAAVGEDPQTGSVSGKGRGIVSGAACIMAAGPIAIARSTSHRRGATRMPYTRPAAFATMRSPSAGLRAARGCGAVLSCTPGTPLKRPPPPRFREHRRMFAAATHATEEAWKSGWGNNTDKRTRADRTLQLHLDDSSRR